MYKMYEMELAGRTLRVDVDRVCVHQRHLKSQETELIFSLLVLNITKDFTLSEKSREDLIKEKGKHPKTQF